MLWKRLLEEQIDVVDVVETWLEFSHDWAANLHGFILFWKDRVNSKGRGVCLYVRGIMKVSVKQAIVCKDCEEETLWI